MKRDRERIMGAKLKGVITTSVIASAALLLAVQEEAYAQWAATFTSVQFGVPQEQQRPHSCPLLSKKKQ